MLAAQAAHGPHAPSQPGADAAVVVCEGLTKRYPGSAQPAVDHVDLEVRRGELLALLGPSGCGKTTTLRLVAGFERPDAGRLALDGRTVADGDRFVRPEDRRVGVVFQDYALFPHMTVAGNVAYGVREKRGRAERVAAMLDLVGLGGKAERRPHELSGGEQQRVALARALAPDPAIVLLDEPFSNLDAALRAQVRAEVREILVAAGATAVFVTHDQEEALSLADRVAVMRAGRVLQVDTPGALYARPAERFVASFVGDADLVAGRVHDGRIDTALGAVEPVAPIAADEVDVVLRPETVRLRLDGSGPGVVRRATFFGHDQLVEIGFTDGTTVRARLGPAALFAPGDRVSVSVTDRVVAFPR